MRKFYLENETGERKALNSEEGIFLSSPAGLGISNSDEYADLEEGFFKQTKTKSAQDTVTGSLSFTKKAYGTYQDFVNWIVQAKRLYLLYRATDKTYSREVKLSYLTKTELNMVRWLEVPAAFICLTPWYLPTPLALNFESDADTAMRYTYAYDERLVYGSAGGGAYTVEIPARGHIPAALRVRYSGAAADLEISLTGAVTGAEYGRCSISGDVEIGESVELFTSKRDSYVRLIGPGGEITDLLDAGRVDISSEPFIRAPVTEPSLLRLTGAGEMSGEVTAQAYFYYRSV